MGSRDAALTAEVSGVWRNAGRVRVPSWSPGYSWIGLYWDGGVGLAIELAIWYSVKQKRFAADGELVCIWNNEKEELGNMRYAEWIKLQQWHPTIESTLVTALNSALNDGRIKAGPCSF